MNKPLNKFIAASSTAVVAASVVAVPASAASDYHPFKDVSSNYEEAVSFLYMNDITKGITKDTFGITKNLTRGDAAVILANALFLDTESAPDAGFKDLNSRVAGAVNALAEAGIVSGLDKDTFAPEKPLTRGAMAKILVKGFELEGFEEESTFVDAVGVFKPYIEALYGTGITKGKSNTMYGKDLLITRGDFSNLLYNTFVFIYENITLVDSAEMINSTSFKVNFIEAVPEDLTVSDVLELLQLEVEFADGTVSSLSSLTGTLSADRKTLTIEHASDLNKKEGVIYILDYELNFDFLAPSAGKGSVFLENSAEPVVFDFAGTTQAAIELTSTDSMVNLNGLELIVSDSSMVTDNVTVILKSTNVEEAKAGEGLPWGTLEYKNGKWVLIDNAKYDLIPAGNYVLEAPFVDTYNNTTTLTLDVNVK
ncbi:hypothetical protein J27TS8_40920 [Robertmurraya siralis]|uniref:SLH domain-containing protein n=1 Tax=Robertmurraya siralis TaxID=77777 RepID=A0A920BVF9_9BACI|nr:S-layer homology domain-containing protein [Robertmurraya siralis]GIN64099.1 hypothetical protein J27TS8_40920 [Robertmurraya siralis]